MNIVLRFFRRSDKQPGGDRSVAGDGAGEEEPLLRDPHYTGNELFGCGVNGEWSPPRGRDAQHREIHVGTTNGRHRKTNRSAD